MQNPFRASVVAPAVTTASTLALLVALAGCGQKGPLALPSAPAASAPAR
jgi:predicted small lipoprotein YifL